MPDSRGVLIHLPNSVRHNPSGHQLYKLMILKTAITLGAMNYLVSTREIRGTLSTLYTSVFKQGGLTSLIVLH